jgi:hypothetical protein
VTNNVELSEESDADLLGQHDTTADEDIVLTEVLDNELPDETVVLRSILPDDAPSISGSLYSTQSSISQLWLSYGFRKISWNSSLDG